MSEYLVNIKNERLSFFTPAGEVKALNDDGNRKCRCKQTVRIGLQTV